jgi:hypothetical protein
MDIGIVDHGSVVILKGRSPEGQQWLEQNISPDALRWGGGFVAEPRYVDAIVQGAISDGMGVM